MMADSYYKVTNFLLKTASFQDFTETASPPKKPQTVKEPNKVRNISLLSFAYNAL